MNDLVLEAKMILLMHRTNIIEDNMDNIRDWIKFSCDRCESRLYDIKILTVGLEEYVAQANTYLSSGCHNILFSDWCRLPNFTLKDLMETTIHEACHIIANMQIMSDAGHGPVWQECMNKCGLEPKVFVSNNEVVKWMHIEQNFTQTGMELV